MSKVNELRAKYSKITEATFNKFVDGDKTPTKKYLKFMLEAWANKNAGFSRVSTAKQLIDEVNRFDSLLPYNKDRKDIYDNRFLIYENLKNYNDEIELIKEEKTFVREDHVDVIFENENFVMLYPKTHKGSLKYGSGTKWCTATRNDSGIFNRYQKSGCLVYLIDKKESKLRNYNKLAFYCDSTIECDSLIGRILIYNQLDNCSSEKTIINAGWTHKELLELVFTYRMFHARIKELNKSREMVKNVIDFMKTLDLTEFDRHLSVVKTYNPSEFGNIKDILDRFVDKVEKSL
jgi:hypothetical protein